MSEEIKYAIIEGIVLDGEWTALMQATKGEEEQDT